MISSVNIFGEAIPCLKHFQNIVFGIVLLSMGLLCRAGDYLSNSDCAALRGYSGDVDPPCPVILTPL